VERYGYERGVFREEKGQQVVGLDRHGQTDTVSKKLANHMGTIKYFICHYNLARAAALAV
jgi:hypothetical protein